MIAGGFMALRPSYGILTAVLVASVALAPGAAGAEEEPLRVFLRGGLKTHNPVGNGQHDYPAFLAEWSKILLERGATVDGALHFPTSQRLEQTDVMVVYAGDGGMVGPTEREALDAFRRRGGGLVVLHDGMCSDDAAWFATVVGAAKQHGEKNWSRGLLRLRVVDGEHAITKGLADFEMDDEAFFLLRQSPGMHTLLDSPLPADDEVVPQAWVYEKTLPGGKPYRSFVWMQGHYTAKLLEPDIRDLILRGIAWAGQRPVDDLLAVRIGQ
jgi:type 1 glutamine amidotransferase